MVEILLLHHAQGLTSGIQAFAEELREAGHTVHVPDLYGGHTFGSLDEGLGYARETGFGAVAERGLAAAEELPRDIVYAGVSLGVMPAQQLAQTRAGAAGALFFGACLPVSEFGETWPAGVGLQVHGKDADPIFATEGDLDAARDLVREVKDAELFLYPGKEHLFIDSSLPSYDPDATALVLERVLAFLAR